MVLIIGAGVSGLAVAKCLNDLDVSTVLVDRHGEPGGAYRRMYSSIQLTSPAGYLRLPGARNLRAAKYVTAGEYSSYIAAYADRYNLRPRRRVVTSVRRDGSAFWVTFDDGAPSQKYSAVVVCAGMFDNPHMPTVSGLPPARFPHEHATRVIHASSWRGPTSHSTKRLVIVGSGVSAVEIAEECVRAGLFPILSTKTASIALAPQRVLGIDPRNLVYPLLRRAPMWSVRRQCSNGWQHRGIDRGFAQYRRQGLLDIRSTIRAVRDRCVMFDDGSSAEVDVIVFATGYRFDTPFLPGDLPRAHQGIPQLRRGQSVAWPGLFFLGVPCAYTAGSDFVHGIAADAPMAAQQIHSRIHGSRVAHLVGESRSRAAP